MDLCEAVLLGLDPDTVVRSAGTEGQTKRGATSALQKGNSNSRLESGQDYSSSRMASEHPRKDNFHSPVESEPVQNSSNSKIEHEPLMKDNSNSKIEYEPLMKDNSNSKIDHEPLIEDNTNQVLPPAASELNSCPPPAASELNSCPKRNSKEPPREEIESSLKEASSSHGIQPDSSQVETVSCNQIPAQFSVAADGLESESRQGLVKSDGISAEVEAGCDSISPDARAMQHQDSGEPSAPKRANYDVQIPASYLRSKVHSPVPNNMDGEASTQSSDEQTIGESNSIPSRLQCSTVPDTDTAPKTGSNGLDAQLYSDGTVCSNSEQHLHSCDINSSNKEVCDDYLFVQPAESLSFFSNETPELIFSADFGLNCTKGCSWSPDGQQLIVAAEDARLRVYQSPHLLAENSQETDPPPTGVVKETEMIYDYCWADQNILTTGRYQPIHLREPATGRLLATYLCYNQLDEVTHAYSLAMVPGTARFLCGLQSEVREYDLNLPGRTSCSRTVTGKRRGGAGGATGHTGIISSLAVSQPLSLYAAGSYSRTIGVYSLTGTQLYVLSGQKGGVTQVLITPDGSRLYSGGRKDEEILCWDLRNPGRVLHTLYREVHTNQRVQFTLHNNQIISGGTDGCVRVWDAAGQPTAGYLLHPDCVNGVSVHPTLPLLATSSGQRQSRLAGREDNPRKSIQEEEEDSPAMFDNSLKIWRFNPVDTC